MINEIKKEINNIDDLNTEEGLISIKQVFEILDKYNNQQKEIPMFSFNTKTKEFTVLGHKFDGVNSIEEFTNYIKNMSNYKNAWNELVNLYENTFKDTRSKNDIMVLGQLKELSKKYGLEE